MPDPFARDVHCVLGLPFDAVDLAGAVARVRDSAVRREPLFLSTPNLNFLIASRGDRAFRDSVIDSDLSIADGMPIVWIARLLGIPIRERVAGSAVFEALRERGARPISVFLFGGPEGAAEAACRRLNAEPLGIVCAGHLNPGFGPVEEMSDERTIASINASGADFVVVALGAKKGQAWIQRVRARLSVPVIAHLGAVVNFAAGALSRAPVWVQRSGLEWLWRIAGEPALWRRYLLDGIAFLRLLATCVLPHLLFVSWRAPSAAQRAAAAVQVEEGNCEIVVRVHGAWRQANLGPLRQCFARVAGAAQDVRVDLSRVTHIDSAFLGLVMLLYGSLMHHGRRVVICGVDGGLRRSFKYACAQFLIDNG